MLFLCGNNNTPVKNRFNSSRIADVFYEPTSPQENVKTAGKAVMLKLFSYQSLLPPNAGATYQRCLRTFLNKRDNGFGNSYN